MQFIPQIMETHPCNLKKKKENHRCKTFIKNFQKVLHYTGGPDIANGTCLFRPNFVDARNIKI